MKKILTIGIILLVVSALLFSLVACGGDNPEGPGADTPLVITVDEYGLATWQELSGVTGYSVVHNGEKPVTVKEVGYLLKEGDTLSVAAVKADGTVGEYSDTVTCGQVSIPYTPRH